MSRAVIVVLDSFGIGAAPDAAQFGDVGANTFGHIAASRPLQIPNLLALGLGHAAYGATGATPAHLMLPPESELQGAYGWAAEISSGKDTPSGHWEMAGVPVMFDWGYFHEREHSFPSTLLADLIDQAKLPGVLGNCHASGTDIIKALGDEHIKTGKPIVYTSADSVFQIAAHEQHFGLERLYQVCEIARTLLDPYNIGRVIARPFIGESASDFKRTGNRRDYAVPPHQKTLLDIAKENGREVISIGKIADIFAHQGITKAVKATGLDALVASTVEQLKQAPDGSLIFTNLVDFDSEFGHRRDVAGYAQALEQFDQLLPQLMATLAADDLLVLTADHGCDPTWPGTDHTREYVPFLATGPMVPVGSIGARSSFADIGQTIAKWLALPPLLHGQVALTQQKED